MALPIELLLYCCNRETLIYECELFRVQKFNNTSREYRVASTILLQHEKKAFLAFQKENALIRNNAHYFVILFNIYCCNTSKN